jgi:hypothetical protein
MKKWDSNLTVEELVVIYRSNFTLVHGYTITYMPSPLTKEWLVDQLNALDWYRRYDFTTKAPEPTQPKPKRKSKPICPF